MGWRILNKMINKIKRKINRLKYYINLFKYVLDNKTTISKVRKFNKLFSILQDNKNGFIIKEIRMSQHGYNTPFYIISSEIHTYDCDFGHKIMRECQYGGYFEEI